MYEKKKLNFLGFIYVSNFSICHGGLAGWNQFREKLCSTLRALWKGCWKDERTIEIKIILRESKGKGFVWNVSFVRDES